MYIIGIDIGKNYHEASIVDAVGNPIGHSLRFSNTHKGADKLMAHIEKYFPNEPCIFGMETTGHYWYSIYSFLKPRDLLFMSSILSNPTVSEAYLYSN